MEWASRCDRLAFKLSCHQATFKRLQALITNPTITSLHLRRCGMWTDTLAALVPPYQCPHLKNLKLDGNSLGYLSGALYT